MKTRVPAITLSLCLLLPLTGCSNEESYSGGQTSTFSQTSIQSGQNLSSNINYPASEETVQTMQDAFSSLDTKKQGWGQGTQVDDQNRPVSCMDFQNKYGKYNALFIKEDCPKEIFLTFDEGYENGYTSQILDVLKEKQVPAVFFVTYDYVNKNPDLIQRMIDEGHVVGNHSYSHPSMPTLTPQEMEDEIRKLDSYVEDTFSYDMSLFRPPMGEFSEQSLAVTDSCGYESVFWSFAYSDWDVDNQPDEASSLKKLNDHLHDGAIYLLHAVSKTNTDILPEFIDQARQMGYQFGRL